MTNERLSPSKKKPLRYSLVSLFPILFLAFSIGSIFANEQINETESFMHLDILLYISIPTFLGLVIILFGVFYGIYKNESFYFSDGKISHEFTFIIKKKVALPLEKINIIKLKRGLFDLLLGTSTLEIGSGNMMSSLKAEIKLCLNKHFAIYFSDYLQRHTKAIKEGKSFDIPLHADGTLTNDAIKRNAETRVTVKMTIADKFKHIFTGPSFVSALVFLLVLPLFLLFINICDPTAFMDTETLEVFTNGESMLIGLFIGLAIAFFIIIGSIIYVFIAYYNYLITKNDDGINISYGLINKKSFLVTFDKIHGYVISRNPLRQLFSLGNLKLCVIGIDEQQGQNNGYNTSYLYPCSNIKKLNRIVELFLPTYKFDGTLYKSTKKSFVHTVCIPILTTLLILLPPLVYLSIKVDVLILYITCGSIVTLGLLSRLLVYKNAAFGINSDFIYAQNGGLLKNYFVIRTTSVQEISTYAGFIRRRQDLCTYFISYRGSNVMTSKIFVRNIPNIDLKDLK